MSSVNMCISAVIYIILKIHSAILSNIFHPLCSNFFLLCFLHMLGTVIIFLIVPSVLYEIICTTFILFLFE